jgi:hypothetical protein
MRNGVNQIFVVIYTYTIKKFKLDSIYTSEDLKPRPVGSVIVKTITDINGRNYKIKIIIKSLLYNYSFGLNAPYCEYKSIGFDEYVETLFIFISHGSFI